MKNEAGKRRSGDELTDNMRAALRASWKGISDKTIAEKLSKDSGEKVRTQDIAQWRKSKAWQAEWKEMVMSDLQFETPEALKELKNLALKAESESVRLKALDSWFDRVGVRGGGEETDVNLTVMFGDEEIGEYAK